MDGWIGIDTWMVGLVWIHGWLDWYRYMDGWIGIDTWMVGLV